MKTIALTILILLSNVKDTSFDYNYYLGYWAGDKTKYTLIVYKNRNGDFEFTNYKQQERVGRNFGGFEYSPEEFVKSESGKLHTFVAWQYAERGMKDYYCDVVYEFVNENKLKATLSGSTEMVLYYTKTNAK
jgi:hypothetical protein